MSDISDFRNNLYDSLKPKCSRCETKLRSGNMSDYCSPCEIALKKAALEHNMSLISTRELHALEKNGWEKDRYGFFL
jgi:hypothetical protein